MGNYSELELLIQQDSHGVLQAQIRYRLNENYIQTPMSAFMLDPEDPQLRDPQQAGVILRDAFFRSDNIKNEFVRVRTLSNDKRQPLRIRLCLDASDDRLHGIAWETINDPQHSVNGEEVPLLHNRECLFSRYLYSTVANRSRLRNQKAIRALVAIANPRGLKSEFSSIDIVAMQNLACNALHPLQTGGLGDKAVSLKAIVEAMSDGVDILYLVCHGVLSNGEGVLWLEDEQGNAARVSGEVFASALSGLEHPPTLVVLCSCQSAGNGMASRNTLAAVGPVLARQGIPAVLAMQGNIMLSTAEKFLAAFFSQLRKHGEVDRAVAYARREVRQEPDWWMPVIFTRLDNARIWYQPGFYSANAEETEVSVWGKIIRNITNDKCTPIIGSMLNESSLGSRRGLARRWGELYNYPLDDHDMDDLPQVAQFLSVMEQEVFPQEEFYKATYQFLCEQHYDDIPYASRKLSEAEIIPQLNTVISDIGRKVRQRDNRDPHLLLAKLGFPIYITTDPSDLLVDALIEQGRKPRVRLFRWNIFSAKLDRQYMKSSLVPLAEKASKDFPVIVKLFGDLRDKSTLVMTEDHYFEYLAKASTSSVSLPREVRSCLNDSGLLFVGFQQDSWEFRVLFRSLLALEGKELRVPYEHCSVQIDPNSLIDVVRARYYIEKYLEQAKLRLYWGDAATFIRELDTQYRRRI
ncbi:CHAT domain-containing protein [Buttiauxella sp. A111]|uniref:CHAT domain-containing protein n=1 Tax=Buttiauxella sp. A111 TaxID=2563088 RepID=UPI0010DF3873|nr:CHAT domain-containing protein [Buttiauxella sp. A111]GDX04619.1 CHAT domain-containing protein [Buttiauxella sp. A111]